jgi:ParB/RepB/Spo0J family partition protein
VVRPISVDGGLLFNKEHPDASGPPPYELVSGERRWRAATLGDFELRAEVRELTDLQVVRIQIIENLHREEVHPLEEAEGYEYLLKHSAEKVTIDQIADEVGKSRSYVYQRMKLSALCDEARKAFVGGAFDASTALLLARLPTPELQTRAIADIKSLGDGDKTPSYRQIRAMLRQRYQLMLAEATFDIADAELVPACGSCTGCPKRTGNQPMLFPDVDNPDVCTDPDCFASKRQAHVDQIVAKAKKSGQKVLEGDDAKEVMPYSGGFFIRGHKSLNATAFQDDDGNNVTYADLLAKEGKKAPKPTLVVDPHEPAHTVSVIDDAAAQRLREKHQPAPKPREETEEEKAARRERAAEQRAVDIAHRRQALLNTTLLERAGAPRQLWDLALVVLALLGDDLDDDALAACGVQVPEDDNDFDHEGALVEALSAASADKLGALAFELALGKHTSYYRTELPLAALERAAQAHGIDLDAVQAEAEALVDGDGGDGADEDDA